MKAEGIEKVFGGRPLYHGLSFSIGKGLLIVKGRSGSGKTTLLDILSGFARPDSGDVFYGSFSLYGASEKEREAFRAANMSFCSQRPTLLMSLSLRKNLELFHPGRYSEDECRRLCDRFGYRKADETLAFQSGGEKKKASLIACFSQGKPLVFLDEPFSGLDEGSKPELASVIMGKARDSLVVLVNHDESIAGLAFDAEVNLDDGSVMSGNDECLELIPKSAGKKPVRRAAWVAFADYFKENKAFSAVRFLMTLLAFLALAASCAFFPLSSSEIKAKGLAFEPEDWFEVYPKVDVNAGALSPISSFEDLDEIIPDRERMIVFPLGNESSRSLFFVSSPSVSDDSIHYLSRGVSPILPIGEGHIDTADGQVTVKTDFSSYMAESALPSALINSSGKAADVALLSPALLENAVCGGWLYGLKDKNGADLAPANAAVFAPSSTQFSEPPLYFYPSGSPSALSSYGVEIVGEDDILTIPGVEKGAVVCSNHVGDLATSETSPASDRNVRISFKTFVFLASIAYSQLNQHLIPDWPCLSECFICGSKELLLRTDFPLGGYSWSGTYLINAAASANESLLYLFYVSLFCFLALLAVSLALSFFGPRSSRKWYAEIESSFSRNGLGPRSSLTAAFLISWFPAFISAAIGFLVYALALVPVSKQALYNYGFAEAAGKTAFLYDCDGIDAYHGIAAVLQYFDFRLTAVLAFAVMAVLTGTSLFVALTRRHSRFHAIQQ
jgi:acetoin utilization transport system ATP-binding protein